MMARPNAMSKSTETRLKPVKPCMIKMEAMIYSFPDRGAEGSSSIRSARKGAGGANVVKVAVMLVSGKGFGSINSVSCRSLTCPSA